MFTRPVVLQEWERQNRKPLLQLPQEDRARGYELLSQLGYRGSWFVVLHVREPGFKAEGDALFSRHKNADISTYIAAIKTITDAGGWVIRLGEPSMSPLPAMPNVIDYAHSSQKSSFMDIFLVAESKFFIASLGGIHGLASTLGTPTLFTNWTPTVPALYTSKDSYIFQKYTDQSGRKIPFRTIFNSSLFGNSMAGIMAEQLGWRCEKNSSKEINDAVTEMLQICNGQLSPPSQADEELTRRYVGLLPRDLGVFNTNISRSFMSSHQELLE